VETTFTFYNENIGYFIADSKVAPSIENIATTLGSDIGQKVTILVTHDVNDVSLMALQYAYDYGLSFALVGDIVASLYVSDKEKLSEKITNEFKNVSYESYLTAKAYINNGLNAQAAARSLYVHRNTFNYRLNKFIIESKLDIRDFWNAIYFLIYIRIRENK
jgi:DNA-binding PucR family transcriptional regulator